MKNALLLICFLLTGVLSAQYGIIGGNNGFGPGGYDVNNDVVNFDPSAGSSQIYVTTVNNTGEDVFFGLVTSGGFGQPAQRVGTQNCPGDDDITGRMAQIVAGTLCNGGAFEIANTNASYTYVLKTPMPNNSTELIWFEVQGPLDEIATVSQSPAADGNGDVPADTPVTITVATQSGNALPVGQAAYLRYSTDNFATSTVLQLTGSGPTYSADIPGQTDETPVTYYVFTSGQTVSPATDGSDADYRTFNLLNNGTSNFSYTTERALPVTLTEWTGRRDKEDVVLDWLTASESGASHFTVECSADNGGSWMQRGTVRAENLAGGATYRFRDSNVPTADLSYRLRQVDLDGSEELSPLLRIAGTTDALLLWPQPAAAGGVYLDVNHRFLGADAQLLDANGRTVTSFVIDGSRYRLPTDTLRPGVYFLVVRGEQLETRRVLIGR